MIDGWRLFQRTVIQLSDAFHANSSSLVAYFSSVQAPGDHLARHHLLDFGKLVSVAS